MQACSSLDFILSTLMHRWAVCEEALEHWDVAFRKYDEALALTEVGTSLFHTALEGRRRAKANRDADLKVLRQMRDVLKLGRGEIT